jgi:hypothetical protein
MVLARVRVGSMRAGCCAPAESVPAAIKDAAARARWKVFILDY